MNAFALGIDLIYADPNMALDAEYRAGGEGTPLAVRVMKRAPDAASEFNAGRFISDTTFLDVRVSEVAAVSKGDTFTIGAQTFEVFGDPRRDSERLVWQMETRLAV